MYFDSATAGEIKRDVYNILVKQSYIYNTSVSPIFFSLIGNMCVYMRTYIYMCVCVCVLHVCLAGE